MARRKARVDKARAKESLWHTVVATYRKHNVLPTSNERVYRLAPKYRRNTTKLPYLSNEQIVAACKKANCTESAFKQHASDLRMAVDGRGLFAVARVARRRCIALEALTGAELSSDEKSQILHDAEAAAAAAAAAADAALETSMNVKLHDGRAGKMLSSRNGWVQVALTNGKVSVTDH